jgi:sugar/nucleoside kinase (ribokinase family)
MVDVALHIDSLPVRGGDAMAHERLVTAGGGFNIMSAVVRQGRVAAYVGQLGAGAFSAMAQRALESESIDILVAPHGPRDLGVCAVLVERTGERTFITSPGAELTLSAEELDGVALDPADVVYFSGYNVVYPEIAETVVKWLESFPDSITVAFDPGPRVADIPLPLLRRVLARTDWLLCNNAEATYLTKANNAMLAAQALYSQWSRKGVVVRDGARGCVGVDQSGVFSVPGYVTKVVDTNGAGDVHNGVVLAELLGGAALADALENANAAASIAISSFGPGMCPTRDEVLARVARGH